MLASLRIAFGLLASGSMPWRLPGSTRLASVTLLVAIGARADPPPPAARPSAPELFVTSFEGHVRRIVPLALLRGRVGGMRIVDADVVVAIDQSSSALLASAIDVDGDGTVGKTRFWAKDGEGYGEPHRLWTSDRGDTVLAAELWLARSAISELGALRNRIGLLTFSDSVKVRAMVGDPATALAALEGIRPVEDWTGTNLARALESCAWLLGSAAPSSGEGRRRVILLFSDGKPNAPDGEHWATQRALELSRRYGALGLVVFTVALGEASDPEYLEELAEASGGSRLLAEDLGAHARQPVQGSRVPQELVIENLTAKAGARAVRSFPDGSFDAIVPLAEGENTVEIRAVFADGERAVTRSVVHYERPDPVTEADRREGERWLLLLRERTHEIQD